MSQTFLNLRFFTFAGSPFPIVFTHCMINESYVHRIDKGPTQLLPGIDNNLASEIIFINSGADLTELVRQNCQSDFLQLVPKYVIILVTSLMAEPPALGVIKS